MPPTFLLVFGLIVLGLIGPVLAAGLVAAALVPSSRAGALRALRAGLAGAAAGLAANVLLHISLEDTVRTKTAEGMLIAAGAGFSLVVIAVAMHALSPR